jgi:hypothetical protein
LCFSAPSFLQHLPVVVQHFPVVVQHFPVVEQHFFLSVGQEFFVAHAPSVRLSATAISVMIFFMFLFLLFSLPAVCWSAAIMHEVRNQASQCCDECEAG